jgi:hypothetical protein
MFFKKLIGLQARTAQHMRGGREIDLPIEQVLVGDEIIVRPGEQDNVILILFVFSRIVALYHICHICLPGFIWHNWRTRQIRRTSLLFIF